MTEKQEKPVIQIYSSDNRQPESPRGLFLRCSRVWSRSARMDTNWEHSTYVDGTTQQERVRKT